ncbi:unnamed protein product [Soboliphyme baturini]|uniref:Peptidase A1 domain-containing protein n=1 Tax=Soboliphyme baturini TaxID=241478 RepID=A0A183IWA9_9BILA|nr:unnamed protein product [Soboliphyme baturini]
MRPDGIIQRALEMGYRSIFENCCFKTVVCNSDHELHASVSPKCLTVDLGGTMQYNHLEWMQDRMEVERFRSCAQGIARCMEDFTQCLRNTELPNDAETTRSILESHRVEREAIKVNYSKCHFVLFAMNRFRPSSSRRHSLVLSTYVV